MNKSQRIRVNLNETDDKHLKVQLDQSAEFFELLSLKIDQKDIYQSFNADYGVLVGRVLANGGVGVPNAKISIFIPISDEDKENPEIFAVYPYEQPYDKNRGEKRYNLLPRVAKQDPETGAFKPKQPFGSFPTKEEVVTNETWLEVYDKYYKYSTVTNNAGDYMLFGVPVGVQTVHMSVDITDIGKYSMSPIDMVTQLGYSENLFTSTGEIKPQEDLDDLPHIETQEISVDVIPFWGDTENFEIGITRQDFRIRAQLINNFVIFGSYFTQGRLAVNGDPDRSIATNNGNDDGFYRLSDDYWNNVDFRTNRVGDLIINLYSYGLNVDMNDVDDDIATSGTTIDPQSDIFFVDPNTYFSFIDNENGQFIVSVPCNRRKVITDEFGNEVVVDDDNTNGIFTRFYGMAFFEHEDLIIEKTYEKEWRKPNSPNNARLKFKIPQDDFSIRDEENSQTIDYAAPWASTVAEQIKESEIWRKKYFTFEGGEFYSVSQFFATKLGNNRNTPDYSTDSIVNSLFPPAGMGDWAIDKIIGAFKVGGTVRTTQEDLDNINIISGGTSGITPSTTFIYDFPYNAINTANDNDLLFGGQWMNMSMYFPQINWTYDYMTSGANQRNQNIADMFWKDYYKGLNGDRGEWFSVGNSKIQPIVGGSVDTSFTLSAHGYKTNFVRVSKEDAVLFASITRKGLRKNDEFLSGETLTGEYMYTPPNFPAALPADPWAYNTNAYDENYSGSDNPYFFKGMYNANAINLLFELNFI
jgi:hypothetical protein